MWFFVKKKIGRIQIDLFQMKKVRRWTSFPRLPIAERSIDTDDASKFFSWELLVVIPHELIGVQGATLDGVALKGTLSSWLSFSSRKYH